MKPAFQGETVYLHGVPVHALVYPTIKLNDLENFWLPVYHKDQMAIDEIDRLTEAAFKADKKNKGLMCRAFSALQMHQAETVRIIAMVGGLLFLGHNTRTARAIKKAVYA